MMLSARKPAARDLVVRPARNSRVPTLPVELIHEILEYCLDIAPETLLLARARFWGYDESPASPPPLDRHTQLLLVSRQWYIIALPILYRSLWISKASHARSIATMLKARPCLGRVVRDLRLCPVEDGFEDDLQYIMLRVQNVRNVRIELECSDWAALSSMDTLSRALPCLKPKTLCLSNDVIVGNKHEQRLVALVNSSIVHNYSSLVRASKL